MRRPRKTWQKVAFWAILLIIGFGLVGSSVAGIWGMGGSLEQPAGDSSAPASPSDSFAREIQELEKQVSDNPEDVAGRVQLAVQYRAMMDYGRAIGLLEEVLVLDAGNQPARLHLAEMHLDMQDYDRTVEHLEALLRTNPDHRWGLYLYGLALGYQEDYPGAVQALERLLSLADSGPDVEHARVLVEEWRAK